jgi:hypothetical protein
MPADHSPAVSATASDVEEVFKPAQIGLRHLLAAMTVAAIAVGISAAHLRALGPLQAVQVVSHVTIVATVAWIMFVVKAQRRRRDRAAAGALHLRVMRKPMTERHRRAIATLLTIAVIADGVFIAFAAVPVQSVGELFGAVFRHPSLVGWMIFMEGLLWGACLNHWLSNVHWVEFREHGILTHAAYYPWNLITRIGWSPARQQNLVMLFRQKCVEMTIDPAAHDAVSEVLERRRGE